MLRFAGNAGLALEVADRASRLAGLIGELTGDIGPDLHYGPHPATPGYGSGLGWGQSGQPVAGSEYFRDLYLSVSWGDNTYLADFSIKGTTPANQSPGSLYLGRIPRFSASPNIYTRPHFTVPPEAGDPGLGIQPDPGASPLPFWSPVTEPLQRPISEPLPEVHPARAPRPATRVQPTNSVGTSRLENDIRERAYRLARDLRTKQAKNEVKGGEKLTRARKGLVKAWDAIEIAELVNGLVEAAQAGDWAKARALLLQHFAEDAAVGAYLRWLKRRTGYKGYSPYIAQKYQGIR